MGPLFDLIELLFLVIGEDLTHAFVGPHAFGTDVGQTLLRGEALVPDRLHGCIMEILQDGLEPGRVGPG